jgi:hypothetical protein
LGTRDPGLREWTTLREVPPRSDLGYRRSARWAAVEAAGYRRLRSAAEDGAVWGGVRHSLRPFQGRLRCSLDYRWCAARPPANGWHPSGMRSIGMTCRGGVGIVSSSIAIPKPYGIGLLTAGPLALGRCRRRNGGRYFALAGWRSHSLRPFKGRLRCSLDYRWCAARPPANGCDAFGVDDQTGTESCRRAISGVTPCIAAMRLGRERVSGSGGCAALHPRLFTGRRSAADASLTRRVCVSPLARQGRSEAGGYLRRSSQVFRTQPTLARERGEHFSGTSCVVCQ